MNTFRISISGLVAPSQRPQGKGKAKVDKDNIKMTDISIKGEKAKPIQYMLILGRPSTE